VKIIWSPQAIEDRIQTYAYISEYDEDAAERMDRIFIHKAKSLLDFPEMGKPGRVAGTREFVAHKHYLLVYRLRCDAVEIATVLHTSRQWPPVVEGETDK
jgi:addiction module RelE/StbE family toxin